MIGRDTLDAINAGAQRRARQLAVNLEARRWLARTPPADRIDVNIATGTLSYRHKDKVAWTTRVVAGAARTPTPLIEERFDQLVVNPPWNVPQKIALAEILPKGEGYLQVNDMYVVDGRVVQRPGPKAALGQIKFDMQNRHAIYLHDTPAKSLFGRRQRFFSHGCVRVENALDFGRRLARESGVQETFDTALASGKTSVVRLAGPIAVRLLYHTAGLDKDGELVFAPDSYGWDNAVAQHIGQGPIWRRSDTETVDDVGP